MVDIENRLNRICALNLNENQSNEGAEEGERCEDEVEDEVAEEGGR